MRFAGLLIDGWNEFWGLSWWGKGPPLVAVLILLIATISVAAASGGGSVSDDELADRVAQVIARTPKSEPTILVTQLPAPSPIVRTRVVVVTATPVFEPTPTPVPAPTPTPTGPSTTFADGIHAVGVDIAAGTYRNSGREGCYWARLSGFSGELDEIITNGLGDGQIIVQISPNDEGFESTRCGTWQLQ